MIKVPSSSALAELTGRKVAPAPAAPAPAPAPAPQSVDAEAVAALQRAMSAMADSVASLTSAIAGSQPAPPPQQLHATVIRDADNRISHLEVNIIR